MKTSNFLATPKISSVTAPQPQSQAGGGSDKKSSPTTAAEKEKEKEKEKDRSSLSPSLSIMVILGATFLLLMFSYHATYVSSMAYSSPSIVIDAGKTQDGRRVLFDDYREAYFWLRQNTHPDAKILSWWDYGM